MCIVLSFVVVGDLPVQLNALSSCITAEIPINRTQILKTKQKTRHDQLGQNQICLMAMSDKFSDLIGLKDGITVNTHTHCERKFFC